MTTMDEMSAGVPRTTPTPNTPSSHRWWMHDIALRVQAMQNAAVHLRMEHNEDEDDTDIALRDLRRHYSDLGELLEMSGEVMESPGVTISTIVYRCGQLANSAVELLTSPSSTRAERAGRLAEVASMLRQECVSLAKAVREGRA